MIIAYPRRVLVISLVCFFAILLCFQEMFGFLHPSGLREREMNKKTMSIMAFSLLGRSNYFFL